MVTFGDAHWAELIRPQRWAGVRACPPRRQGLKCTQWLRRDATADSGINDQLINITALIHGLDVFGAQHSAILLSTIFSAKYLMPQNYYITWRPLSN